MNQILLDTHAAVWSASGELAAASAKMVESAVLRHELLLSPISAWEISMLARIGRIRVPGGVEEFVRDLFRADGVSVAKLTPSIAAVAGLLEDVHGDPADRILIATAAAYGAQLMTHDKRILDYAKATKHIRCIAC